MFAELGKLVEDKLIEKTEEVTKEVVKEQIKLDDRLSNVLTALNFMKSEGIDLDGLGISFFGHTEPKPKRRKKGAKVAKVAIEESIIKLLKSHKSGYTKKDMAKMLDKEKSAVHCVVNRLYDSGIITHRRRERQSGERGAMPLIYTMVKQ